SVPMVMISMSMLKDALRGAVRASRRLSADAGGEQVPVVVDVRGERVDSEKGGERERYRDEAAVKLVPVLGESTMLPSERLAGVAEGEPRDRGADEDVLDDRLELPRAACRDDDATALGPPAKSGHRQLPPDQKSADPEGDASPERDIVEVVPLT